MTDKVVKLVDRTDDARHWTPADMLEKATAEIQSGLRQGTKAAVLYWDDTEEDDQFYYQQSGMSRMEFIALLETVKHRLLGEEVPL